MYGQATRQTLRRNGKKLKIKSENCLAQQHVYELIDDDDNNGEEDQRSIKRLQEEILSLTLNRKEKKENENKNYFKYLKKRNKQKQEKKINDSNQPLVVVI